mmetsp:Transcript_19554/g.25324  ORF Transcript_19554/g.25324 Transcript_19554/m.25324 type:complete len:148 (+) Transcript_19554:51-494(+)
MRRVLSVFDETEETWNQRGGDLIGDNNEDGLAKNEISSDGTYLVAGSLEGYFKIFQWNGSDYEVREKVSSEDRSFGKLIDISADRSLVVYANPSMDDDMSIDYLYETGVPVDASSDEGNNESPAFHSLDYGMTSFVMSAMIFMSLFY